MARPKYWSGKNLSCAQWVILSSIFVFSSAPTLAQVIPGLNTQAPPTIKNNDEMNANVFPETAVPLTPQDIVWPEPAPTPQVKEVPPLLQSNIRALLASKDAATRLKAVQALSYMKSPEALDELLVCCEDSAPDVQRAAAEGLASMPEDILFAWAMQILMAGSSREVLRLDAALPWLRNPLESRMLAVLTERHADTKKLIAAVYGIGRMRSTRATKLLIDLAWVSEPTLAVHSANALATIGDAGSATALVDLLGHSETGVREAAVAGLTRIGGPLAVTALSKLVTGSDEKVTAIRRQAVIALAQFDDPSTVPALIQSMSSDISVRPQAGAALRRITKMEFRDEPGLWSAWYQEWLAAQAQANKRPPLVPSSAPLAPKP